MSFKKALHLISLLRRSALRARPAGIADLEAIVELAFEAGREQGTPVTAHTIDCLRTHYSLLLRSEAGEVFLVERGEKAVGMVCLARTPPEAWDGAAGAAAWGLYTVPEERKKRAAVGALLRAVAEQALSWEVQRFRVSIGEADPKAVARYERAFGFRRESTQHTYLLSREG